MLHQSLEPIPVLASPSPVAQSVAFALPKTDCWEDQDRILLEGDNEIEMSWDITLHWKGEGIRIYEILDWSFLETMLPKKPKPTPPCPLPGCNDMSRVSPPKRGHVPWCTRKAQLLGRKKTFFQMFS